MASALDRTHYCLTVEIDDISTANSDAAIVAPFAGEIVEVHSASNATTTGTAAFTVSVDGTAVTFGTGPQIAAGAGFVANTAYPTGANSVNEGSVIKVLSDGGSTNAAKGGVTIVIKR